MNDDIVRSISFTFIVYLPPNVVDFYQHGSGLRPVQVMFK